MNKIYITSDLHLGHDKEFLYRPRGYSNIQDHDKAVEACWNILVDPDDTVYILGDCVLNDTAAGIEILKRLNGHKHLIYGNHETQARMNAYREAGIFESEQYSTMIKYKKYNFYLSHYPTKTNNYDEDKPLRARVINLCGHTHTQDPFLEFDSFGLSYHCELDAHGMLPVDLDQIIENIKSYFEIKKMLKSKEFETKSDELYNKIFDSMKQVDGQMSLFNEEDMKFKAQVFDRGLRASLQVIDDYCDIKELL